MVHPNPHLLPDIMIIFYPVKIKNASILFLLGEVFHKIRLPVENRAMIFLFTP
jgi:hypothetical protein